MLLRSFHQSTELIQLCWRRTNAKNWQSIQRYLGWVCSEASFSRESELAEPPKGDELSINIQIDSNYSPLCEHSTQSWGSLKRFHYWSTLDLERFLFMCLQKFQSKAAKWKNWPLDCGSLPPASISSTESISFVMKKSTCDINRFTLAISVGKLTQTERKVSER